MTTASAELLARDAVLGAIAEQRCERGTPWDAACVACYNAVAALTRAVQPAAEGGAVDAWQQWSTSPAEHEAGLREAFLAGHAAALTPPLQPAADAEVELTARYLNDAAVVLRNGGYMEFAGNNDQAAALLRLLAAERAAPAPDAKENDNG